MLCDYGCGQEAKHQFGNGKWCCSGNYRYCIGIINKIKETKKKKQQPTAVAKKTNNIKKVLCDFGCGIIGKYQYKNGKWCCNKIFNSCSIFRKNAQLRNTGKNSPNFGLKRTIETKRNMSKNRKGKGLGQIPWNKNKTNVYSKETRKSMGCQQFGEDNPFFNKKHTIKSRKKMSDKAKKRVGEKAPMYNKKHTNKSRKKMSKSHLKNPGKSNSIKIKFTIKQIQKKYPTFAKIEEMRYEPGKENEKVIQVRCKNHNCKNSKEQGGWFTPTGHSPLYERIRTIEKNGRDNAYFYCSEKCKQECPLYRKKASQLIKEDLIRAGHLEEPWHNSQEYQIWRNQVFKLDNKKCVWCGIEATVAHHILPQKIYPELSLDPENGISCCQECHMKYGHRDRWCTTGFLAGLVCDRVIKIQEKVKEVI